MADQIENVESPLPVPKPASRRRRLSRKLLALAISTLIALLFAEMVIRWVAPQVMATPTLESVDGMQLIRANLTARGYVPGLFDATYHTNSQRFRARQDYPLVPRAGVTRIITTGDSFCFGNGVEDDQAYPLVMEKLLQGAGKSVEVINAGVGGTGTGTQALWFDKFLAPFKPKVVVLSIFVNDIEDDLGSPFFTLDAAGEAVPLPLDERVKRTEKLERARKRVNAVPGYAFLAEHSHLVNLVRRLATLSMQGPKAPPKTAEQVRKDHDRFMAAGVPLFEAELRWLKRHVESSGGKLVVAWFPTRETIYPDTGADADESRWQAQAIVAALGRVAAKENLPVLDPTAAFKAKATAPGMTGELFFKGADRHPNVQGYRLFAEEVTSFLLKSGLLANQP
jgi:lysophospholipase L1-like esterase